MTNPTPKITTFLWYNDNQAHEAATFYTSLLPNSSITSQTGQVTTFQLSGQPFAAMNGGPQYKFTPAISLCINCDDQAEVDRFWTALTADGGTPNRCGWVTDKYGVSWQVVPKVLPGLLQGGDGGKAGRVMRAMLRMKKIVVAELEAAYAGETVSGEGSSE